MLKFLSIVLVILLITAPEFCTTSNFAVETITEDIIRLEPLTSKRQEPQYIKKNTFPNLSEGEIVTVTLFGEHIIGLKLDQNVTSERQRRVANLLNKLESHN